MGHNSCVIMNGASCDNICSESTCIAANYAPWANSWGNGATSLLLYIEDSDSNLKIENTLANNGPVHRKINISNDSCNHSAPEDPSKIPSRHPLSRILPERVPESVKLYYQIDWPPNS